MKKFVKVPIEKYIKLQDDSNELYYLECCGVNNWESGVSREEFERDNEISLDFNEEDIIHEIIEE